MKNSDALRVALISETLEAPSAQRRRAALILLDMAKTEELEACGMDQVAAIRREAGAAVAEEVRCLLDRLGVIASERPDPA